MDEITNVTGILINDHDATFSLTQVCQRHHIPEDVIIDLLEYGLFDNLSSPFGQTVFNHTMITRLQAAHRLQHDLGINSPGIVLVLELRDELEQLRNQLNILHRHIEM